MGGAALATTQVNSQIQDDLAFAERIAFPLLFLLTLWVFRSLVAALLPIVCGALTILGGLLLLRLLDLAMPSRRTRSTSSRASASALGSTTACSSSRATARSSRAMARPRSRAPDDGHRGPYGRVQLGHGRRCGRDACDLPARLPALDGHRRRSRRSPRRAHRADGAARALRAARRAGERPLSGPLATCRRARGERGARRLVPARAGTDAATGSRRRRGHGGSRRTLAAVPRRPLHRHRRLRPATAALVAGGRRGAPA